MMIHTLVNGRLRLKLDDPKGFVRRKTDTKRQSPLVRIGAFNWSIVVNRRAGDDPDPPQSLRFFVQCHGRANESPTLNWNCNASVTLRVVAQKPSAKDKVRTFSHAYTQADASRGYPQFAEYRVCSVGYL